MRKNPQEMSRFFPREVYQLFSDDPLGYGIVDLGFERDLRAFEDIGIEVVLDTDVVKCLST